MIKNSEKVKLTHSQLKQLIYGAFDEKIKENTLDGLVSLKIGRTDFSNMGLLAISSDLSKATIKINLSKFRVEDSFAMTRFKINQTVAHEFEHAKTLFFTQKENFYSYEHMMSLMEYLYYANVFQLKFDELTLRFFDILSFKKHLSRNYDLSPSELIANLASYRDTIQKSANDFDEQQRETFNKILASLTFLNDYIDIYYGVSKAPVNRFAVFLCNTGNYIKKYPEVLQKFQILRNIFNDDGTAKSAVDLYTQITPESESMYRRLIIDHITSVQQNDCDCFQDGNFRKYMETLMDDYVLGTIDYYKNMKLGTVFENPKVLTYNLMLRKKKVQTIHQLASRYNLRQNSGTVIDSNGIH